jgi:hypothetical protein
MPGLMPDAEVEPRCFAGEPRQKAETETSRETGVCDRSVAGRLGRAPMICRGAEAEG